MGWTQLGKVFKTLLSRRTTSDAKAYYEEFADVTLDIYAGDVKAQYPIQNNPAQSVTEGIAIQHTLLTLVEDNTVANQQSYYATSDSTSSGTRLKQWISDRFGDAYRVRLYDNANNEIFPTDVSQWLFDNTNGVLIFNGNTGGFAKPFKISGYRYIGDSVLETSGIRLYEKNTTYKAGTFLWFNPNNKNIHIFQVVSDFTSANLASDVLSLMDDAQNNRILHQSGMESTFTISGNYAKGMWLNNNLTLYRVIQSYTNNGTNSFEQDKLTYFELITVEFTEKYISPYQQDVDGVSLINGAWDNGFLELKLGKKDKNSFDDTYFYKCVFSYNEVDNIKATWVRWKMYYKTIQVLADSTIDCTATGIKNISWVENITASESMGMFAIITNVGTVPLSTLVGELRLNTSVLKNLTGLTTGVNIERKVTLDDYDNPDSGQYNFNVTTAQANILLNVKILGYIL